MATRTAGANAMAWRRAALAAAGALLGACASSPPAPIVDLSANAPADATRDFATKPVRSESGGSYRVMRGDTLYAIAFSRGLDFRDVANWNSIAPPYRIYAGQELRLQAPASGGHAAPAVVGAPVQRPAAAAPTVASAGGATSTKGSTAPPVDHPGIFEDVSPAALASASNESTPKSESAPPPAASSAPAPASAGSKSAGTEPPPKSSAVETKPQAAEAGAKSSGAPAAVVADNVATAANGLAWRWPGKGSLVGAFVGGDPTHQGIDIAGKAGDPVLAAADGDVVYSGNGLLGYGELIIIKHNSNFLSAYGHNRKRLVQEGEKIRGGQQIAEMGSSATSRDELHFEIRKNGKPVNPLDYLPAR